MAVGDVGAGMSTNEVPVHLDPHPVAPVGLDGEPVLRPHVAADRLVADARRRIGRLRPQQAWEAVRTGALLVDIRAPELWRRDGAVPGAVPVARHVLEWRLDPTSPDRLPQLDHRHGPVVVLCSQGYSSSLAADVLTTHLGVLAADVIGGIHAWQDAGLPWSPGP